MGLLDLLLFLGEEDGLRLIEVGEIETRTLLLRGGRTHVVQGRARVVGLDHPLQDMLVVTVV